MTFWQSQRKLLAGVALAALVGTLAVSAPVQAATLRMAWSQDATGLDPHKQTAFSSLRLLELVYEPLVRLDANLTVGPALADSWEFAADGSTSKPRSCNWPTRVARVSITNRQACSK